jgi:flagellar assembly protein FliH
VYLNDEDKKLIDTNDKVEQLVLTRWNQDKKAKSEFAATKEPDADGFTQGLNATVIGVSSEEEETVTSQRSDDIIEDARLQASEIIKQAELDAKDRCQSLYEEAKGKGYEEGLLQGQAEIELKKQELNQLIHQQHNDYFMQIQELEPAFANIVAACIVKITGIIVEEKQEIIQYLIHNAITDSEVSKSFVIRVSKGDYDYVLSRKDDIQNLVSSDVIIEIALDKELSKNQCLIETDSRIIDCSLDVQLSNLVQDIKLLSTTIE